MTPYFFFIKKNFIRRISMMRIILMYINQNNLFYSIDRINVRFIRLVSFVIRGAVAVYFFNLNELKFQRSFIVLNFLLRIILIIAFLTPNLLTFFIIFERTLIPIFRLILLFGKRRQKSKARYYLIFFTIFAAIGYLRRILYCYINFGTLDWQRLQSNFNYKSDNTNINLLLWFRFLIRFWVKVPLFPFHSWLPEAHVEASTYGSIILARLLLKLGTYGILKFNIWLFPNRSLYSSSIILSVCRIGRIYVSFCALRQLDLKRMIAYSSIAHISVVVIGLFSINSIAITGSVLIIFGHRFISAGLFRIIGFLYSLTHSRLILSYSNLKEVRPIFSIICFLFILANFSFPFSRNFTREILILLGLRKQNRIRIIRIILISGRTIVYCIWIRSRLIFGTTNFLQIFMLKDLPRLRFLFLRLLFVRNIRFGIYPLNFRNQINYINEFQFSRIHKPLFIMWGISPSFGRFIRPYKLIKFDNIEIEIEIKIQLFFSLPFVYFKFIMQIFILSLLIRSIRCRIRYCRSCIKIFITYKRWNSLERERRHQRILKYLKARKKIKYVQVIEGGKIKWKRIFIPNTNNPDNTNNNNISNKDEEIKYYSRILLRNTSIFTDPSFIHFNNEVNCVNFFETEQFLQTLSGVSKGTFVIVRLVGLQLFVLGYVTIQVSLFYLTKLYGATIVPSGKKNKIKKQRGSPTFKRVIVHVFKFYRIVITVWLSSWIRLRNLAWYYGLI